MSLRPRSRALSREQLERFHQIVLASRARMQKLDRSRAAEAPLHATLDEVEAQHEALVMAEEALRAQREEIAELERRLAEERARSSELFERITAPHLETDRFAVIRDANAAAADLLGVEPRSLRGKPLVSFVARSDVRPVHEALEALAPRERRAIALTLKTQDGADVKVAAEIDASDHGGSCSWSLSAKGRTESPPADLARALRDSEELLVRERRARRALERTNQAKDRFIAVLAHDLRAPLNAILGWTQMMRSEILDRDGRERALATIERNGRNQLALIEELLDVSRMDAERLQLDLAPLDLAVLVEQSVEAAEPQILAKELAVTLDVERRLTVVGDRPRLGQVVSNLLTNAIKFTDPGGKITVRAAREGRRVSVSVTDTGRGVSPEVLPHVFEMYLQERNHSSSRAGLGLGLYLVKRLVELHGGSVTAESEGERKGATFGFALPHREDDGAASERQLPAAGGLDRLRILVVDDDEDARDLMSSILRRAGGDVSTATSRDSAIEVFDFWQPDVVVSDLAMPDGDGCELIARLRAKQPRPFAALAVTGFAGRRDAERAVEAGFDLHIGKPIDASALVEAVEAAAARRRLTRH